MSKKPENRPLQKVRVGTVQLSLFRNEGEKGHYYKAELDHAYQKEGSWHSTSSYGRRDLINLAKAALLAESVISGFSYQAKSQAERKGE